MNSDSHFLIGHSHQICEDYALSGNFGYLHYAIITDGCSSSKDVDIGARILAKTAENAIGALIFPHNANQIIGGNVNYYSILGKIIAFNANRSIQSLGLSETCLDSTLLIVLGYAGFNHVSLYAYGDGVFAYDDSEGNAHIVDIEYESGAPYYLSYRLNEDRRRGYFEQFSNKLKVTHYWENNPDGDAIEILPYNADSQIKFEDIFVNSYVSAMSDGVNTFHKGFEKIGMVKEFMGFKNSQGEFVKRRMNAIKRRCDKEGIKYNDDISMASLHIGEIYDGDDYPH